MAGAAADQYSDDFITDLYQIPLFSTEETPPSTRDDVMERALACREQERRRSKIWMRQTCLVHQLSLYRCWREKGPFAWTGCGDERDNHWRCLHEKEVGRILKRKEKEVQNMFHRGVNAVRIVYL